MDGIGTVRRSWGSALGAFVVAALACLAAQPAPAAAVAPEGPPFIGYNDDFNRYDLRTTTIDDPLLDLPISLPDLPVLPGSGEEETPPDREANGAELMARAREGGAGVIRYVVPWARVERDQGSYDWEVEDESYELALEAGLKPVILLHTAPCWAHPSISCEDAAAQGYRSIAPDPDYLDEFGAWAAAAIERYPRAAAFEVWNESNYPVFWGPSPNPASYVAMLQAVHDATAGIAHPPILFNGLIPKPGAPKYLKRALGGLGGSELVDATATHPYVGAKGVLEVRKRLRNVRKILASTKAPRAVWITEVGWSTNAGAENAVSDEEQAARIIQLVKIAPTLNLKSVIIHRLRDVKGSTPWEQGLGVTTADDEPKPIFCALGLAYGLQERPKGC